MLCYSFLDIRGDYIKRRINWTLYNNENQEINTNNVLCEYREDKIIIYQEDNYCNKIDLINKIYIREGNDYLLNLDFNINKMNIILKDNDMKFETKFDGNMTIIDNEIKILYKLDNEIKKIIIHLL